MTNPQTQVGSISYICEKLTTDGEVCGAVFEVPVLAWIDDRRHVRTEAIVAELFIHSFDHRKVFNDD